MKGNMSDERKHAEGQAGRGPDQKLPIPPRTWIVWTAIFGGIILLMLFRERMESQGQEINQYKFEQLVNAKRIVSATVNYNAQNPALIEVSGRYSDGAAGQETKVPFRAKIRLTNTLEDKLLSLPEIEVREPDTLLFNVVRSMLPIIIIGVMIWFFFIRQIRRVARNSPGTPDLQARTSEQQDRFDKIMEKWEEQTRRMDAVLDRMEKNNKSGP
jgi:ATP-dependent Zn protease